MHAMKLVTAIMPTRGRPLWARKALASFLSQDYPEKELIICDDATDPSFGLIQVALPDNVRRVVHGPELKTIAQKRNICCELATGDLICHFDSDDWSDPRRISTQVRMLEESGLAVAGFNTMLFVDEANQRAGVYRRVKAYALGTSLMYTKVWWSRHRFPDKKNVGEDNHFVKLAIKQKQLALDPGERLVVARTHADNTSTKRWDDFHRVDYSTVPAEFLR